jgi:hypothetical protein
MWKYVAARYASWEWIAAYEPMSEPRVRDVPQTDVAKFYQNICTTIHSVDKPTPCMIGPAAYYKIWQLSPDILIDDPNVIYTFDFFLPWDYITEKDSTYTFPGMMPCNKLYIGVADRYC